MPALEVRLEYFQILKRLLLEHREGIIAAFDTGQRLVSEPLLLYSGLLNRIGLGG